jgi:hypothetical protein
MSSDDPKVPRGWLVFQFFEGLADVPVATHGYMVPREFVDTIDVSANPVRITSQVLV